MKVYILSFVLLVLCAGALALNNGDMACLSSGLNVRYDPCGVVAFTSSGNERGKVLEMRKVGCNFGTYTWVKMDMTNRGHVWAALETGLISKCQSVKPGSLAETVQTVGDAVSLWSERSDVSIAVYNLKTNEKASYRGDVTHVSASAAKAIWTAAALDRRGVGPVAPFADAVFRYSDNDATGRIIDTIGADAVNDYYRKVGMPNSGFARWGPTRIAKNCPGAMGSDNYFSANDAVTFLRRMDRNEILSAANANQLKAWMKIAPRSGYGGWLGSRLPNAARNGMMHKAGWLPPGTTSNDAYYTTLTDIGIIEANNARYAIAILIRRGKSWDAQVRYTEWASCMIYRAVTKDASVAC